MKTKFVVGVLIILIVALALALGLARRNEATMGKISLIIPEATVNLVEQPSIELEDDEDYYTEVGGATDLDRVPGEIASRRGHYSLRIEPAGGNNDGVYYAITLTATTQYTWSVDVLGEDGIPYRLRVYDVTGGVDLGTPTEFDGDDEWHRYELTFTTGANTDIRLYVEKNTSTSTASFYIDGMQCEAKGYATTYCDGDQGGCSWVGMPHASTSERDAQWRGGGRVIDLDADYDVHLLSYDGLGLPPIAHNVQELAQQPGALLESIKVQPRVITLSAYVGPGGDPVVFSDRARLIDAIKPDLVIPLQPVTLRYTTGTDRIIEISCLYDTGLQGSFPNFQIEKFVLRLICYQPFWQEDGESSIVFDEDLGIATTARLVIAKIDGEWERFGPPAASASTGPIYGIVIAPDKKMYIGGDFTDYAGIGNADYIAVWDPATETWAAVGGVVGADSFIYTLALSPDGDTLYVGGAFTNIGGGAANRIAKYVISTNTWSALGAGANAPVHALAVGPDGLLYLGGEFTTLGGGAADYIGVWDGAAFSELGGGADNFVQALAVGLDRNLYVGGRFNTVGAVSADYAARWSFADSAWYALGEGLGDSVYRLAVGKDGLVYAGGVFTTLGSGDPALRLAKWSGSVWEALGSGVNDTVWALAIAPNGDLYVGGEFTEAGDRLARRCVIWNGYAFVPTDFSLPGASRIVSALLFDQEDFYAGFNTTVPQWGVSLVADNEGSASVHPVITFRGGDGDIGALVNLQCILNEKTGQAIYLDYNIMPYETLTIDLQAGTVVSDFWGSATEAVLPGSDFSEFVLLPGENRINLYGEYGIVSGKSMNVDGYVRWHNRYWSIDGAE